MVRYFKMRKPVLLFLLAVCVMMRAPYTTGIPLPQPEEGEETAMESINDFQKPHLDPVPEPEPELEPVPDLEPQEDPDPAMPDAVEKSPSDPSAENNSAEVDSNGMEEIPEVVDNTFVEIDEKCKQPPDTGMCRGYFPMFYFDPATRRCKQFIYGGCHGNKNAHRTAQDCYRACYPRGIMPSGQTVRSGVHKRNYLTLHDGKGIDTLTFVGSHTSVLVDETQLTDFSISMVYELQFDFRTDSPHGLIAFLGQATVPRELAGERVQFYVYLKRGHLAATHIFGNRTETFIMRRGGLQAGNWHSGIVKVSAKTGTMMLEVDSHQEFFTITSLQDNPNYLVSIPDYHSHKDLDHESHNHESHKHESHNHGSHNHESHNHGSHNHDMSNHNIPDDDSHDHDSHNHDSEDLSENYEDYYNYVEVEDTSDSSIPETPITVEETFTSKLWIGGVPPCHVELEDVVLGFSPFHGCLRKIALMSGPSSSEMVMVPMRSSWYKEVKEQCSNNCGRQRNLCAPSSQCMEHFDHSSCNCFNSGQDDERCSSKDIPVLTLHGDGYVVQRLYEWMDRVHSYTNVFSISFQTRFSDSILFYGSAEYPEKQYVTASITRDFTIHIEINLGGGAVSTEIKVFVNPRIWHTLTLLHQHNKMEVYIDKRLQDTLTIPGEVTYLHLDPDFYIGNVPNLPRECGLPLDKGSEADLQCYEEEDEYYYDITTASCKAFNFTGCSSSPNRFPDKQSCTDKCHTPGLRSLNPFIGCVKEVFVNDISILQKLKEKSKTTRYHGMTKDVPLCHCSEKRFLPVTFSTEASDIQLTNMPPTDFHIALSFKPSTGVGVLASGYVDVYNTTSMWEIRYNGSKIIFYIHDNLIHLESKTNKAFINHWHYVDVQHKAGKMQLMVDHKNHIKAFPHPFSFSSEVTVGSNLLPDYPGFVGCIRKIKIGGQLLDMRTVVGTPMAHKDVLINNCEVLGPCERPDSCEHGATCTVIGDTYSCNCTGTGYTGKKCHFSLYKRSCEEYRQSGYKESGVYRIDVDGNGPLPSAYVKCFFDEVSGKTTTIVEHSIPKNYEVRKPDLKNFRLNVEYRDFTKDMLTFLVEESQTCSQEIEYQCRRSPLMLSRRTWFASPTSDYFSNFGSSSAGICRCKEVNACATSDVGCNCDVNDGLPRIDQGVFKDPELLPITSMVFLQDFKGQKEDTEGMITLQPLKCLVEASEEHIASFTVAESYLELPAWRHGILSFSFKTVSKKAVLAYQPAYHPDHATFKLSLVSDKELEFMYQYKGKVHRHSLATKRILNSGVWQQVSAEIYDYQLRFIVNSEERLIDIDRDTNLGVLDGSLFIGAIPEHFSPEEENPDRQSGLKGCIRGLTFNEHVIDLTRYVRAAGRGVIQGCTPSCESNPCQNNAECIEHWGTYECVCENPIAHSGTNCENNINENAITFTTEESKYKYFINDSSLIEENNFLHNSFLINFRTHSNAGLILFAYDYVHNFLQLYLSKANQVVLLFNYEKVAHQVEVDGDVVFNEGQPVQVVVERTETSTTLTIYTRGVFFSKAVPFGVGLLHEDDYEQFPFGESQPLPTIVYYPHSVTKPRPFYQAYLGSADDRRQDVRSPVSGFIGCIRGLKIGDELVSLTSLLAESIFPVDGVKPSCKMACDLVPCANGGSCTEDFENFNNFQCDCDSTSYTGATCTTETGYTFSGNQWISQDSSVSPLERDFEFEIAFSVSRRHSVRQLVALLRSTDSSMNHDYLLVGLESDGSIQVEAQLSDLDKNIVHGARVSPMDEEVDAFDGHRHYVIVKKSGDGWKIMIDGKEYPVVPLKNVYISETSVSSKPTRLYLGGVENGIDDRLIEYHNFHGCISNVKLRTPDDFSDPLREYNDNDLHLKNYGLPGYGSCAAFAAVGVPRLLLSLEDNLNTSAVMGPEWISIQTPKRMPFTASQAASTHPERDTPMDNVVPAVAGCIFLIILIILAVIFIKMRNKKKKQREMEERRQAEEMEPLFNGMRPAGGNYQNDTRTQVFTVSEARQLLPLKSEPLEVTPDAITENGTRKKDLEVLQDVPLGQEPADVAEEAKSEETPKDPEVVQLPQDSPEGTEVTGRPLSWDKATDNLPLIIGQDQPAVKTPEEEDGSSSSSSIDQTIDITGTPTASPSSSPKLGLRRASEVSDSHNHTDKDSPSSTRVNRGSPMPYMDEDAVTEEDEEEADNEPLMIKYVKIEEDAEGERKLDGEEPKVIGVFEKKSDSEAEMNKEMEAKLSKETEAEMSKEAEDELNNVDEGTHQENKAPLEIPVSIDSTTIVISKPDSEDEDKVINVVSDSDEEDVQVQKEAEDEAQASASAEDGTPQSPEEVQADVVVKSQDDPEHENKVQDDAQKEIPSEVAEEDSTQAKTNIPELIVTADEESPSVQDDETSIVPPEAETPIVPPEVETPIVPPEVETPILPPEVATPIVPPEVEDHKTGTEEQEKKEDAKPKDDTSSSDESEGESKPHKEFELMIKEDDDEPPTTKETSQKDENGEPRPAKESEPDVNIEAEPDEEANEKQHTSDKEETELPTDVTAKGDSGEPEQVNEEEKPADKSQEEDKSDTKDEESKTETGVSPNQLPDEVSKPLEPPKEDPPPVPDSDDDFVELRPEREQIHEARLIDSKVTSLQPLKNPSLADRTDGRKHRSLQPDGAHGMTPVTEERMDIKKYFLTKKPSVPPALPPKEKKTNF